MDEVMAVLAEIDHLFKDFFNWVAGQYDPVSGGFYYARSSREDASFQADIESTGQAMNIIKDSGLLDGMPDDFRRKAIKFFQERQDPITGHFLDPHNEMRTIERLRVRGTNYSVSALNTLGGAPLYPLPGATEDTGAGVPEFMADPQTYRTWMESLNWGHPWGAGDAIAETTLYLNHMSAEKREQFLREAFDFIETTQDKTTGLWGSAPLYNRVSGAFKIAMFYNRIGGSIPNPELIYESTLQCLRNEVANHFCFVRNPVDLLLSLKKDIPERIRADILEILRITERNMAVFLRPDGAFSVWPDRSNPAPNRVTLGLGKDEADMNASTQGVTIRNGLYKLVGLTPPHFPKAYTEGFWTKLQSQ